jgi:hypothetical protein
MRRSGGSDDVMTIKELERNGCNNENLVNRAVAG